MNRFSYMLLALVLISSASAQEFDAKPVAGIQDMALSNEQIQSLSEDALRGDSSAAGRLGGFYLMVNGNRTEAEKWYRIAAENSSPGAQRQYGTMLLEDSKKDKMNRVRGIFWLKKAADGGDVLAKTELQKLGN